MEKGGVTANGSWNCSNFSRTPKTNKNGKNRLIILSKLKKDIDRLRRLTILLLEFIRPLWSTDPWVPALYVAGFFFCRPSLL